MEKEEKSLLDDYGQLPIEIEIWLQDNAPDKIMVDTWWVEQMLRRLVDLRRLAKSHLAEADIPTGEKYLLDLLPENFLNSLNK